MNTHVSIFLVDDHTVIRQGLKELIEQLGDYRVTREFNNGKELLNHLYHGDSPDVIIMDITMPVMDGKETLKKLKEKDIITPVIVLTMDTAEATIIELFRIGARGYLSKTCSSLELRSAIDAVMGKGYYHNDFTVTALQAQRNPSAGRNLLDNLTDREQTFLKLVCDEREYTYEQIANLMHVHKRTVDGYREALFTKLDVRSKTGLVLFAVKHGLLEEMKE